MILFGEHRLISYRASDFGYTSSAAAKATNKTAKQKKVQTSQRILDNQRTQRAAVENFNKAATKSGSPIRRQRTGVTKDVYNEGKLPVRVYNSMTGNTLTTQYSSANQKAAMDRGRAEGDIVKKYSSAANARMESGQQVDYYQLELEKQGELSRLDAEYARRDAANQAMRQRSETKRAGIKGPENKELSRQDMSGAAIRGRANARGAARMTTSQRLGLTPPPREDDRGAFEATPQKTSQRGTATSTGSSPVYTEEADVPSNAVESYTKFQREASGALNGDTLDNPGSLDGFIDEEMAAIDPVLDAQDEIRSKFKIYQKDSQALIDKRGSLIEKYKTDSIDRSEQIADAKIEQSKANRDLELETIEESRSRQERDELLTQEKTETDYEREEDRIISENASNIERLQTSLGARYGGFGSGKGIKKIQGAREEGSRLLRELTEDKIYARREHMNKLQDIEDKWKTERKEIFNRHDVNVTNAFIALEEAGQRIDDKALEEEGEKLDKAAELLTKTFDTLEKSLVTTGAALSEANQRAITRRDDARKEEYQKKQDAMSNMFSALNSLPSNSPFFRQLEVKAGLTPGTIAANQSFEGRRMVIAEGQFGLQQKEYALQLQKFNRDGNQIDTKASEMLGYFVTSTGEVFRDYFGNPVSMVGAAGTITASATNDRKLFGESSVGVGSTVNFSRYAIQLGDIVPGSPYHKGGEYDIDNIAGTPIPVWNSGTVSKVNMDPENPYGIFVDVFDGVNTTRYAHLQAANVTEGMYVNGSNSGQSQILGLMGNTGNTMGMDGQSPGGHDHETGSHLHLEVRSGEDFDNGSLLEPMDVGMVPGQMFSGNVVWVDEMRKSMRSGTPVGTREDGGTFSASDLDTPWQEIDQQILELSKDMFRDAEGKTDWRSVELVYDYMQQNKMGNYEVSYDGKGAVEGSRQASKEIEYATQIHGRSNVTNDRQMISKGVVDADKFYNSLIDGTLDEMEESQAKAYLYDMGYIVSDGLFSDSVREMDSGELQILNARREASGLPPIQ